MIHTVVSLSIIMRQATLNGKLLQFSFEIICFSAFDFYLGISIKMIFISANIASGSLAAQTNCFISTTTTTTRCLRV